MLKKYLSVLLLISFFLYFYHKKNHTIPSVTLLQKDLQLSPRPPFQREFVIPPVKIIHPPGNSTKPLGEKSKKTTEEDVREFTSIEDFQAYNLVPQDEDGNIYITDAVVEGEHLIAHGDIIVGSSRNVGKYGDDKEALIMPVPSFWPKGIIPFVIEKNLPQENLVKKILTEMNSLTHLRFIVRTNEINFVKFKKGPRNCYSHVGMIGGEQFVSLGLRCGRKEILHEIMHTVGFFHEQNRMDRDEYVQILWENIAEEHWPQFQKIKTQFWEKFNFPFSFNSILLYPSRAFSQHPRDYSIVTVDGTPFSSVNNLSSEDIARINKIYSR
ncbi:MAG: M12 family metallopeptidase [Halobacteriovoraceae bacterium]|nr:M12 family metallopeptidase [Halobacteriovoraceae bacterium]